MGQALEPSIVWFRIGKPRHAVEYGLMSKRQFVCYIIINGLVAIGTIGAVVVALFSGSLKTKFFPPILSLELLSDKGEEEKLGSGNGPEGRYYFLQLENKRRWSKATEAGLHMLRLQRRGPDREWVTEWAGDLQFQCRDQNLYPLQRDIGGPIDYEVLSVRDGKPPELRLYPIIVPYNLTVVSKQPWEFVAWFQGRSSEVDSDVVRLQVSWDGRWESGETEMQNHLQIKLLNPSSN